MLVSVYFCRLLLMSKVFLDIGNSFVKWSTVDSDYYEFHGSVSLDDIIENGLASVLELDGKVDAVFFSSVADKSHVDLLKTMIQDEWQLLPHQLTSQQSCLGLTTGYKDFAALGDDRWFAMLGAIESFKQPVIVIDAGTALTIDAIVDGQHQGGFIVPGLYSMRQSLSLATADLDDYSQTEISVLDDNGTNLLATDTSSAILGGTLYMAAAFVNQIVADLNLQLETQFKVLLTGGEASKISSLLDMEFELFNDLVLQGMVFVEESIKKA